MPDLGREKPQGLAVPTGFPKLNPTGGPHISWLGRQANTIRTDQARIGRLEAPEGHANGALEVNVLIIGAAEREVCRCGVTIRDRREAEDETP